METLGAAIIGCGAIGPIHAEAVANLSQGKLVAVVDPKKERRERLGIQYGCKAYETYEQALQNPEVKIIHICTPHYLHVPMAIKGILAGKHVLIEKPLGMNLKEVDEMKKVLLAHPQMYAGVIFQNRYNETSQKAKQMIEHHELGEILGLKGIVTWYRSESYYRESDWRGKWTTEGGGVLINQAIHTLDLLQWLGGKIKQIKGRVDTRSLQDVIEVEDTSEATFYYENKTRGIFYATNSYTDNSSVEIEIHGTQGKLTLREGQLIFSRDGKSHILEQDQGVKKGKPYWGSAHQKQIEDFYQCIINSKPYPISVREAGIAIEMIQGIYESHRTGKPYTMQYV